MLGRYLWGDTGRGTYHTYCTLRPRGTVQPPLASTIIPPWLSPPPSRQCRKQIRRRSIPLPLHKRNRRLRLLPQVPPASLPPRVAKTESIAPLPDGAAGTMAQQGTPTASNAQVK